MIGNHPNLKKSAIVWILFMRSCRENTWTLSEA